MFQWNSRKGKRETYDSPQFNSGDVIHQSNCSHGSTSLVSSFREIEPAKTKRRVRFLDVAAECATVVDQHDLKLQMKIGQLSRFEHVAQVLKLLKLIMAFLSDRLSFQIIAQISRTCYQAAMATVESLKVPPVIPERVLARLLTNATKLQRLVNIGSRWSSLPNAFTYCNPNCQVLNLSNGCLKTIPPWFIDKIRLQELNLHCCNLESLPSCLGQMPTLKKLVVSRNPKLNRLDPMFGVGLVCLEEIDLRHCGFTELPASLCWANQMVRLYAQGNMLSDIPASWGQGFEGLRVLILNENHFTCFPSVLQQMSQLDVLDISRNKLECSFFGLPPNLRLLDLSDCDLIEIPEEVFNLSKLRHLHMNSNAILSIPPEIGKLVELRSLLFAQCGLSEIPKEIKYLTNLECVRFSTNESVTSIPPEVGFHCSHLMKLSLRDCSLSSLPKSLCMLKQLVALNISQNQLLKEIPNWLCTDIPSLEIFFAYECSFASLPDDLSGWAKLEQLNLTMTNISQLPASFPEHLQCLKQLILRSCKLTRFPVGVMLKLSHLVLTENPLHQLADSFGDNVPNLKKLRLDRCQLTKVPKSLANAKRLTDLNLARNDIRGTMPTTIWEFTDISSLDLSMTGLSSLPSDINALRSLRRLNVSHNPRLRKIPENLVIKCENLEELIVSHCSLIQVPVSILGLHRLTHLDMSHNRIQSLPENFGLSYPQLVELDISQNKLRCLPSLFGMKLKMLHKLALHCNRLSYLPATILELPDYCSISLQGNRLAGYVNARYVSHQSLEQWIIANPAPRSNRRRIWGNHGNTNVCSAAFVGVRQTVLASIWKLLGGKH